MPTSKEKIIALSRFSKLSTRQRMIFLEMSIGRVGALRCVWCCLRFTMVTTISVKNFPIQKQKFAKRVRRLTNVTAILLDGGEVFASHGGDSIAAAHVRKKNDRKSKVFESRLITYRLDDGYLSKERGCRRRSWIRPWLLFRLENIPNSNQKFAQRAQEFTNLSAVLLNGSEVFASHRGVPIYPQY
jgi:hypothetical protein